MYFHFHCASLTLNPILTGCDGQAKKRANTKGGKRKSAATAKKVEKKEKGNVWKQGQKRKEMWATEVQLYLMKSALKQTLKEFLFFH